MKAAVFLDRDGVLIADVGPLTNSRDIQVFESTPEALRSLHEMGLALVVVSNQTVVARGLATEADVAQINSKIEQIIRAHGGPALEGFYICPHHPKATLEAFRADCDCRKPKPGLLLRAAREHGLDLAASFIVGDRITDIIAGARVGCRTILVQTGKHLDPPIETSEPLDFSIQPDHTCADLAAAAQWILQVK